MILWLPISPQSHNIGVPNRIRTGVNNVKGCRPRPLDDRDIICKHTRTSSDKLESQRVSITGIDYIGQFRLMCLHIIYF